jgi:predicted DNA binding CopG/RHH family protein
LDWLRETAAKKGVPYQCFINDLLAEQMKEAS